MERRRKQTPGRFLRRNKPYFLLALTLVLLTAAVIFGVKIVRELHTPAQPSVPASAQEPVTPAQPETEPEQSPDSSEQLRREDGTADVAAERKGDENQRDFIAVADGRQRVIADEFSGDEAVGDIIELLEDDAAEKRQTEPAQHALRPADGQVSIHRCEPPCAWAGP